MRATPVVLAAAALLFAAPGTASADVIFDPADADELAAVLAEATAEQDVCYGWDVRVDNAGLSEESVGSNLGAGVPMNSSCDKRVQLNVYITWTSESSESEDSASYDVESSPDGITRADLDSLDLDWDELTGENPDVVIGKAVTALPLLAADKGIAKPIAAAPRSGTAPADARLTDDPGSDFWRSKGGTVLWGVGLILAGGLFAWWVLKVNRTRRRRLVEQLPPYVPDTVPMEFYQPPKGPDPAAAEHYQRPKDPDLAPAEKPEPEPTAEPEKTEPEAQLEPTVEPDPQEGPEPQAKPEPEESTVESQDASGPEPERPAPSDQKDKE